jgi:hypothetical protein
MLTKEFCVRGKFWEKHPHTHSPPPLSVVGVYNTPDAGDVNDEENEEVEI